MSKKWMKDYKDLTFEELVCMYINDCKQYLGEEGDILEAMTARSQNQDYIFDQLRELKDMCMEKAGFEPMKWERVIPLSIEKSAILEREEIIMDDRLVEQTRRWLTRCIFDFHHNSEMRRTSDEKFEQWHEDKAKELLNFLTMTDIQRMEVIRKLNVDTTNPRRAKCLY